jgi:Na+/H+ antiporter NhaD/arsenite permease-like protein
MLVVFLALCRILFRDALREPRDGPGAARAAGLADLRPSDALTDRRLLARCLAVLPLVLIGFALHTTLHLEPAMVALLGAGLMVLVSRTTARQYLEEVEWPTLVFFMALFVLVGGLVQVGVIAGLGQAPDPALGRPLWWAFALGADLGGNTTAVAAGANVVVTGIAAREGHTISFWQFTRYGLAVTAVTLVIA